MAANGGTTTAGQFSQKEADIQMMLSADVHLGTKNRDYHMERYVYKRRDDGIYIFNLGKTWEKLQKAARVMAGGDQWTTAQIPDAAWPGEAEQPISAAPTVGVPLAAASDGWDTTVPPQAAVPAAGLD